MSRKSKPVVDSCPACHHYKLRESQLLSKKFRHLTKENQDGRYHFNIAEFREPFVVEVTQRSPRCCMHAFDWYELVEGEEAIRKVCKPKPTSKPAKNSNKTSPKTNENSSSTNEVCVYTIL